MSWSEKIRNFKSQGGKEYPAWNWLMRIFNVSQRSQDYSRESRNRTRRIEAKQDANSEMLQTLVDRSLTEEQREARVKQIAANLAEELDRMDAAEVAERLEIQVKDGEAN